MKTIVFLAIAFSAAVNLFAQLSGKAKILYDSAYAQDPSLVTYATERGAEIIPTPDNNSFYIQWFPKGAVPETTPIVVTLHGSHCNAFMEFKSWYPESSLHGCGIIALQWNRYNPRPPYDYFPDDTLYSYINSAMRRINYPSNKALLHGFSRGAARSYAMVFNDIKSGNNFFCTIISNSGDADLSYPLYRAIDSGAYGANIFKGKHWNLFCGNSDSIVGCAKMNNTQKWLQLHGAIVDIFIQDPKLGHDGFQWPSSNFYKDSILNNYLKYYNDALSVYDVYNQETLSILPNPFSYSTVLLTKRILNNATLTIFNTIGLTIKQIGNINGNKIEINRKYLPSGLYFARLTEGSNTVGVCELIITD